MSMTCICLTMRMSNIEHTLTNNEWKKTLKESFGFKEHSLLHKEIEKGMFEIFTVIINHIILI